MKYIKKFKTRLIIFQDFGTDLKIASIQINMYFNRKDDAYHMYSMDVVNLVVGSKYSNGKLVLDVKDKREFKVLAPIGLSFTCGDLGMFKPVANDTTSGYK
jgi:hypothetical protein